MNDDGQQRVINELQTLIDDTHQTLTRFVTTDMDNETPADYEKLLDILIRWCGEAAA